MNIVHSKVKILEKVSTHLWHDCMAHVNEETIQKMKVVECLENFNTTQTTKKF